MRGQPGSCPALAPNVISDLIREAIESRLDTEAWEAVEDRALLHAVSNVSGATGPQPRRASLGFGMRFPRPGRKGGRYPNAAPPRATGSPSPAARWAQEVPPDLDHRTFFRFVRLFRSKRCDSDSGRTAVGHVTGTNRIHPHVHHSCTCPVLAATGEAFPPIHALQAFSPFHSGSPRRA